ncbi:MAG: sigma-54-dependent Fis family transcriptional regulator [Deltaproteobacteria bacterium]|jgi:DNA-binding NtrC family response regulator|nr:sigma-54-dependent Fis family transcriptional regulator [Deltaproteobacteria bacterium]
MKKRIQALIVDDEAELRKSVISILRNSMPDFEFDIEEAADGREAVEKFKSADWDLVLMDVRMPNLTGIDALKLIRAHDPRTFVVLMTAHSNLQDAVAAIKEGAYDYLEKPVQPQRLIEIVTRANEAREMVSRLALSNPIFDDDIDSEFVGTSKKMRDVFDLIHRLCKVDTTVLIRGENGTGKELVARAIHFNSPRKSGSMIAINCGAIPENLMESELFGHEKGSFTGAHERKIGKFQLANNGTIFLDEVAELKPEMQVRLLRVLQERKFMPVGSNREVKTDARIIAATNRNLEKMIEEGTFREDLFYRLNVMPIFLPPLRERTDDIGELSQYFMKRFTRAHNRQITAINDDAMHVLKQYRWPGNIRELENVIERAFIVENSDRITVSSLPETVINKAKENMAPVQSAQISAQGVLDYDAFKEQAEKEFIVSALRANKGRINKTVAEANIPKNTLLRKIKRYEINVDDFKD